jgi:gamma-glutamyltranspeptidase/glutathione hydrolase
VRRFRAVAADEPRAALVGRDVLSGGGSAADAAVAMYFVMSVTLPSTASLGGGGVCLVHDPADGSVRALDFIARAPSQVPASATRPSAVPGSVRGMYALHARFGRAAWSDLLGPAEALAREGSPMSRALARDLVLVTDGLLADGAARLIFGKPGGVPLKEGELLRQIDLATVLTRLRMAGAGDFYAGKVATALTRGAAEAGGSISRADLAAYRAEWRDAVSVVIDDLAVYTSPPPTAGGITAAQMWLMLGDNDRFVRADDVLRPHLFAEVSMRAFADRASWLGADGTAAKSVEQVLGPAHTRGLMSNYNPSMHTSPEALAKAPAMRFENPAASSLVAMDDAGMAVACVVGTHNLFGTGRVAGATGIVLAASPDQDGFGPAPLAPMMVLDQALGDLVMVAAASGGAAAPTALVWTAVNAIYQHMTLPQAVDAPRIHHGGAPDRVLYEPEASAGWIEGLERRGHIATEVGEIGRVNAIFCPDGRAAAPAKCQAWSDRRGEGMAIGTGS